jgi:hypothetical protein
MVKASEWRHVSARHFDATSMQARRIADKIQVGPVEMYAYDSRMREYSRIMG